MTSFPYGQISVYGANQALTNEAIWVSYIGPNGAIFNLAGPLAPVPGAQTGVVLRSFSGLVAPFTNLDLKGARQSGATYTGTVYDPLDLDLQLEFSATGPDEMRELIRAWIGAWDPTEAGILSVFTPDAGEWWCQVRMGKTIIDTFKKDYTWSGRQPFTWNCKGYGAFWESVDSVSSPMAMQYQAVSEDFAAQANAPTLGSNWTQTDQTYGALGIVNAAAQWVPPTDTAVLTNAPSEVNQVCIYSTGSQTENQVIGLKLTGPVLANLFSVATLGEIDLWGRLDSTGANGIRLRIGQFSFKLSYFIDGVENLFYTQTMLSPPLWNDTYVLTCGTPTSPYTFTATRNGNVMWQFTDYQQVSAPLINNRNWGFGVGVPVILGNLVPPPPISQWWADDNAVVAQSGFVTLTNRGDIPAWPRYLCYGPGTFQFGGPGGAIVFGPLLDGQIALLTSDPRMPAVVDLSPSQPPQVLTPFQQLMENLISYATNNNVPPLLQQFESKFGILPPQGNMYALLNGRFTTPVPATPGGTVPVPYSIPVKIVDGTSTSQIVAAITPRRRWPL